MRGYMVTIGCCWGGAIRLVQSWSCVAVACACSVSEVGLSGDVNVEFYEGQVV